MDKKNNKVSNMYGRARRIAFLEKVVYWAVGILTLILVLVTIFNDKEVVDTNVNFAFLREHLEGKGYRCERINIVNGRCKKIGENNTYSFIRLNDGFEYINNSKGYILDIKHSKDDSKITFKTTDYAFAGVRNQLYTCKYKDNVINELENCYLENGEELNIESYKSIILQAMYELNIILDNSGYYKDTLLNDFSWEKKD